MTSQQELCTINIRVADDRFPRPYKVMAGVPTTDTTQSSNQLNKALTIRPLIRSPKLCTLCLVASPSQDIDLSVDLSSSQSVAYLFCVACNDWLCADHSNIHSRLTARLIKRSDHKVYTVDQYMNDSTIKQAIKQSIKQSPGFPLFPCTHHQLPLEHYCLKCKAYVCVRCIGMAQQSTRQSLCPLPSNHCDHSENHLQSLHDRWNDQIKELNVNPDITISLNQLQTQQNRVISSINHNESNVLVNIHKAIHQSIKTSVSSLVDQGIEKMTKQTHNLSQTIRSNLIHHKSKLIKSRQSVNQIVTQLNHQTCKLSFVEVGRSIRLLDQLLKQCNKFNFKPKVRKLIVQSNHTPIRQSDEPTVMMSPSNDVRVDNPSTDRLSYGIDRTINTYSQTLQIILKNWMFVELVPLKLSVYPAYPLAKQQAQLEQPMSEASVSQSITESVSSSSEPKDETNSESSNNTDSGCDNCLFIHTLNTPINHSTSVSHLEEDLLEPPALTWSNILSRIRALPSYGSLLDPAPTESIRFDSNVGEFADLLATQSICDDIRSLSFDQKLSLFQFEDVDITALMWFMATRLTTLSTYSQSCDTSALNPCTVVSNQKPFLLPGMALVLRMHTTFCTNWSVAFTNLSSCPHLVELAITGVHLESTAVVSVGLQLLRLTNLKKFDMSDIKMDKKSGTILARNLQHLTALEYLDLSGNNVACVELRDSLRKMPRVRYLDISDIGLVGEQCKMFSDAFSPTHQIDHLDLSSNNLGRNGIKDMCDGLYHLRQIRWFSARRTGLDGTTEPCSRIVALLIRWARIATLDLSENKFGDEGIAIISTDMSTVFMREMEFENCSFGDRGMHALLARFPRLPVMRKINVTKNRISRLVCKRASEMTRSVQLRTDYNDL